MSPHALLEIASALAMGGAIVGVVLNNAQRRGCFLVWMVTNALSLAVHAAACLDGTDGMLAMAGRDLAFLALAVHGWLLWGRRQAERRREEERSREDYLSLVDAVTGHQSAWAAFVRILRKQDPLAGRPGDYARTCGMSGSRLYEIETGQTLPTPAEIEAVCRRRFHVEAADGSVDYSALAMQAAAEARTDRPLPTLPNRGEQ